MRLKKQKNNKSKSVGFRCTQEEYNRIQQKANIYCEGSISEYLIYSALHFVPGKEDFEPEPKRRKKK